MALTTLATAIEAMADLTGDYLSGTCTTIGAAAGATLIDARLKDKSRSQDDYFNDMICYITAGTSVAGDERYISDFTAASGTVTPYQAFSAQVPSASTYLILKMWAASDIRRALNMAITDGYPWISRLFVDETLDTVADTWSYSLGDSGSGATVSYTTVTCTDTSKAWQTNQYAGLLIQSGSSTATIASNTATTLTTSTWSAEPTDADAYQIIHPIREVLDVSYQSDATVTTRPYPRIPFEVRNNNGILTIQLLAYPPVGKNLRIVGRGPLTTFTATTTSTTEIGQPHIKALYYLAAYHLFSRTPSMAASKDREFYEKEASRYYGLWEHEIQRRKTGTPPKRIWSTAMGLSGNLSDSYYLAANDTP